MTTEPRGIMWPMPDSGGSLNGPTSFLDGARVLQIASLSHSQPTGATWHVVTGIDVSSFAALAIAQYEGSDRAYLFYCDADWRCTLTDRPLAALSQRRDQAVKSVPVGASVRRRRHQHHIANANCVVGSTVPLSVLRTGTVPKADAIQTS